MKGNPASGNMELLDCSGSIPVVFKSSSLPLIRHGCCVAINSYAVFAEKVKQTGSPDRVNTYVYVSNFELSLEPESPGPNLGGNSCTYTELYIFLNHKNSLIGSSAKQCSSPTTWSLRFSAQATVHSSLDCLKQHILQDAPKSYEHGAHYKYDPQVVALDFSGQTAKWYSLLSNGKFYVLRAPVSAGLPSMEQLASLPSIVITKSVMIASVSVDLSQSSAIALLSILDVADIVSKAVLPRPFPALYQNDKASLSNG